MMHELQDHRLARITGNSIIAWGIVVLPLSVLTTTIMNCAGFFVIWAGIGVRRGSRLASLFALIFSAIEFVADVAIVVSAGIHGVAEVGALQTGIAACFAVWMLLNMALLAHLRRETAFGGLPESTAADAASGSDTVPARTITPASDEQGGVLFAPIAVSRGRFPQFTLRSMFVLAILVALACAIGTQPITLTVSQSCSSAWGPAGIPGKTSVYWYMEVVRSRAATPVIGYVWRLQGPATDGPTCFDFSSPSSGFRVEGQPVTLTRGFILFYNDTANCPQRLDIPREEAIEVFGSNWTEQGIEKFWQEKIEPLRKASAAPPAGQRSVP
jgi:hypothetical protein